MNIKYRVANRFRFTIFAVVVILVVTTLFMSLAGLNRVSSLTVEKYVDVEVVSGDTLWSIAENYMHDSGDIRQSVHSLSVINNIKADDLYPGMIIKVPVC